MGQQPLHYQCIHVRQYSDSSCLNFTGTTIVKTCPEDAQIHPPYVNCTYCGVPDEFDVWCKNYLVAEGDSSVCTTCYN